jgi:ArsR family transcriptional regulator
MMDKKEQIEMIQEDFKNAQSILTAIGDETRHIILLVLMESDCKSGMRVGEITAKTHLSRPAVSHQLKILKDIGIVKMRREGTKNFYHIDVSAKLNILKKLVMDIEHLMNGFYQ